MDQKVEPTLDAMAVCSAGCTTVCDACIRSLLAAAPPARPAENKE